VVARRQLDSIGLTPQMVRSRLKSGHLVRLHRGVYAVGHRQLRPQGISLAALFAVGPGAVLSHRDAAGLHNLRPANHRETDVTVDGQRRPFDGVRVYRASLPADDVTTIDGLPVTTLARTLVDLAGVVPKDHLAKALNEAERARKLDLRAIERVLARTRTRNGPAHRTIRAALEDLRAHGTRLTRSKLEVLFAALVRTHELPFPATNAHVHGREVDAWWSAARLAVELDGWQDHGTRRAFQRDREKGNALAEHGVTLLRFTYRDIVERPGEVAAQIARILKRAERG
jgi:very-short-patch-repair endonuclease